MLGTHYVFSLHFFRFWVAITFVAAWVATLTITIMPLWQGRHTLRLFVIYMFRGNKALTAKLESTRETKGQGVIEEAIGRDEKV